MKSCSQPLPSPHSPWWRHNIQQGECGDGSGWEHDFCFYAFESQVPGTIPYAVGHADNEDGGWKYRCEGNIEFAGDKGWEHDFVFYVFPVNPESLVPISIGFNDDDWTYKCRHGASGNDEQFKHSFIFKALNDPHPESIPISVGCAGEGAEHRSRMSQGEDAGDEGWEHQFTFHAFDSYKPGTVPIAVGHADFSAGGWKYRVESGDFAGDNGWEHDFVFYAFPADESMLIPVSFGYEDEQWCTMVEECEHLDCEYFNHQACFYAFRVPYPGTVPIAIGKAGDGGDHTLRSRTQEPC